MTALSTDSSTGVDILLREIVRLQRLIRRHRQRERWLRESRDQWRARALRRGL